MENTYYVVCNANGPISVRLKATTEREALAEFEKLDGHAAVDGCRTDAEDDLIDDAVDCHSMDDERFSRAMVRAGATHVLHLDHDWSLWVVTPD